MATCRNCAAETSRHITHFEGPDGSKLKEPRDSCPERHPEEFDLLEKLELVPNHEANPNEYDTLEFEDGERVPIVKDWARGECEQRVIAGPVAQSEHAAAVQRKRAFARERNKQPLTPAEIETRVPGFRAQFEQVERMMGAQAVGIIVA